MQLSPNAPQSGDSETLLLHDRKQQSFSERWFAHCKMNTKKPLRSFEEYEAAVTTCVWNGEEQLTTRIFGVLAAAMSIQMTGSLSTGAIRNRLRGKSSGRGNRRSSVIRWKQSSNRSALIVFDKPKGFGLVRVFEDLEVIEAVFFLRQLLEFSEASED